MKKYILLSLLFFPLFLKAQLINFGYDSDVFQTFLKGKTYVILTKDDDVNEEIQNAVKKYWDLNEYQFVDADDAEKYKSKLNGFLLMDFNVDVGYAPAPVYGILPCSKKETFYMNDLLCYVHFDSYNLEKSISDANYRMEYIIKSICDALEWVNDTKPKTSKVFLDCFDHFNAQAAELKNKTLLIPQEVVETQMDVYNKTVPFVDKKALELYPFKYEIKPFEEIYPLMEKGDDSYCLLIPTANMGKLTINIYDLSTKSLMALTYHVGNHITEKTFKEFLKELDID